jgi:hypothetical protein
MNCGLAISMQLAAPPTESVFDRPHRHHFTVCSECLGGNKINRDQTSYDNGTEQIEREHQRRSASHELPQAIGRAERRPRSTPTDITCTMDSLAIFDQQNHLCQPFMDRMKLSASAVRMRQWCRGPGGIALVQEPEEAAYSDMPENAIAHDGPIDLVGPVDSLAERICTLVGYRSEVTSIPAK